MRETPEERKLRKEWEARLQAEGLGGVLPPDGTPSGVIDYTDGATGTFTTDT